MTVQSNPLKIIDMSVDPEKAGDELLEAAKSQGFLFIEGHGLSQTEVDALFDATEKFFDLPKAYKENYLIDRNNEGYTAFGAENLDPAIQETGDPKEAFNINFSKLLNGMSLKGLPDFFIGDSTRMRVLSQVMKKLHDLSIKVLEILAFGLKMEDKKWFTRRYLATAKSGSTLRMLHYPRPNKLARDVDVRAGAHTDYGSMTFLFQRENQEGLEILLPVENVWQAVPFVQTNTTKFPTEAPPLVVNIADQLSYWTADLLHSTLHRVRFQLNQDSSADRYSIVFFSHPNDDALLEPVPSDMIKSRVGKGANHADSVLTAGEHLDRRLASTYGW